MKRKMLTGGQAKLDKNKNNRIDAEDFKMLRAEKSKKKPIKAALGTIALGAMAAKMLKGKKKKATKMSGVGGALGSGMLPGMSVADLYQKKLQEKEKVVWEIVSSIDNLKKEDKNKIHRKKKSRRSNEGSNETTFKNNR